MIDPPTPETPAASPRHVCPTSSFTTQLDELFGLFRRRWISLALGMAVGVTLAALYCWSATALYESTAEILVMQKDSSLPTRAEDAVQGTIDSRIADGLLATHMQIIASPQIVGRALKQSGLESLPSLRAAVPPDSDPVGYIMEHLEVQRGGTGQAQAAQVLNARFRYPSEADSASILGSVIEAYQQFIREKFQNAGLEAASLITKAKDELTEDLRNKEAMYSQFREETPLLWRGEESVNIPQVRLVEIEKSLMENRLRNAQVQSRLGIVERALNEEGMEDRTDLERVALIDGADIARLTLLLSVERGDPASEGFRASQPARAEAASAEYDRLLDLRLEAKRIALELGPNHPKVIETRQGIEELEGFLTKQVAVLGSISGVSEFDTNELMAAYAQLLRHDRVELQRRSEQLEALANQEQEAAKNLVSYELRENSLRRDVERSQVLYDTVVDRLREINFIKDYGGFVTEVISPVQAGEKVWPNWPLSLLLGGFAGLVLGSGAALGFECRDRSFHGLADLERGLQLPLLARIPDLAHVGRRQDAGQAEVPEGATMHPLVVTYQRPESPEAEAFRALRGAILFSPGFRDRMVIQVASPRPGEGTTTLVSNLAVSIGKAGKRVLIVDCNLGRPRIHQMFGITPEAGLSTFVRGGTRLDDVTSATASDNLCVVPCGSMSQEEVGELLSQPRFDEFIESARQGYDVVLLDSADLQMSDAMAVAARADAVLLHIRLGENSRPESIQARQMLAELGTEVLGVAVRGAKR